MKLIEIRDLDGPNLFALRPVIKVELRLEPDDLIDAETITRISNAYQLRLDEAPLDAMTTLITAFHERVGLEPPPVGRRTLDTPKHIALYYPWDWNTLAAGVARAAFIVLTEPDYPDPTERLRAALERDRQRDSRPLWITNAERAKPVISISGTNGKTTTTRLLAHIFQTAGKSVGWTSTSGVYINGECVLEGDYTGPSGARRVLRDPDVDIAILETARGGILLRGVAYESNDVGVLLNVSPDHLSLQGVETLETLAEVKGIVVRLTKPDGTVILNADDPLVLSQRERVSAPVLLFSQSPGCDEIDGHVDAGGRAIVRDGDHLVYVKGENAPVKLVELARTPVTLGGAADHMVENAMAAAGAALSLGLSPAEIASGLQSFRSDSRSNTGRMNIFELDGRKIIVDYAHNEKGLEALAAIARTMIEPDRGRFLVVAGTAGDRQDEILIGIGEIAAREADCIYLKDNPGYRRGREAGELMAVMRQGIERAGGMSKFAGDYPDELSAFAAALDDSAAGDVIAVMCQEQQTEIFETLANRGAAEQ